MGKVISAEIKEEAARLWNIGKSAAEIGNRLGLPRNSVVGMAFRNRGMFQPKAPRIADVFAMFEPRQAKKPKPGKKFVAKRAISIPFREPDAPVQIEPGAAEYDAGRVRYAKSVVKVGNCECRYLVTDNVPYLFCAEVTVPGKSWCPHHYGRVFGIGTKSEQIAVAEAAKISRRAA